jgi:CDGSH-type Zn-finger protein
LTLLGGEPETEVNEVQMAQIKITARKNGPYRVEAPEGSIELVDSEGNRYDLSGKTAFSLCRCGGSVNKPFCDGTHSKIGFQAAEAAVRKEESAGATPETDSPPPTTIKI